MAGSRSRVRAATMIGAFSALCACARQHAGTACGNPFPQLTTKNAALPSTVPSARGGVVIIGTVADSETHHALREAIVLFQSTGRPTGDTSAAYTDSAGGFATRLPSRGRYAYSVRSVNYSMVRGSIDVARDAETLRVVQSRGLPLCDVRLTAR
jgi:hypothetical protein